MASIIQPVDPLPDYRGLPRLFEFTNEDGALCRYNCAQAAVATLLRHLEPDCPEKALMPWLERDHGPDNLGGWLGSSRRRVERGLRARGHRPMTVQGEDSLRRRLEQGVPIILTCQLSVGTFWKFDIPSGHWMVAFGYDAQHVYLTNWWDNRMTWEEFRKGWFGWVPALTNMRGTGLTCLSEPPTK